MASSSIPNHYPWPSAVNVANFITTRLWFNYPNTNYEIWKEQMLCLIEGQDLLGFINGSILPPVPQQENYVLWRRSDRLLKGWILGSLHENMLPQLAAFETARDVWWELETGFYELAERHKQEQKTSATKLRFTYTNTNYEIWKEQILGLIKVQNLLGFIDGSIPPPRPETPHEGYLLWTRHDRVVKAWIFGTLDETLVSEVGAMTTATARDVWSQLELKFSQLQGRCQNLGLPTNTEPGIEVEGKDFTEYTELYKAVLEGNWEVVKRIFDRDPTAISARLDSDNLTPLHVAARTGKTINFLQKMVDIMPLDAIAQTTTDGRTALHFAAAAGNVNAARILVNRMPKLLYVWFSDDPITFYPIQMAAMFAQRKMIEYLISVTKVERLEVTPYDDMAGLFLLLALIRAEYFDIALDLVIKYPYLARMSHDGLSALSLIAEMLTDFGIGSFGCFWARFIPTRFSSPEKQMMVKQKAKSLAEHICKQMKIMTPMESSEIWKDALIRAARVGNSDLVEMIIEAFPDFMNVESDSGGSIFHIAVENRSQRVFDLVCQMRGHILRSLLLTDNNDNNILHATGKLAPSHKLNHISGAALQLQRELQWYKQEVEKLVSPQSKNDRNTDDKTPREVFTEEHKRLKEEGEKWMKDTSASCSIAAALIVTIMFAAAITVPGDYDNATGFPTFSKDGAFIAFGISNAISLFTSSTSLLVFLSILTSRYAEEDFLYALPKRLIAGLATLFLSVLFMMVAFIVTIYLVVGRKNPLVFIPLVALACLPISSFVLLQYPLLADLISSTYGPGIFGKQRNLSTEFTKQP